MRKFLDIFNKILLSLFILGLVSCGGKKSTTPNIDNNYSETNILTTEKIEDSNIDSNNLNPLGEVGEESNVGNKTLTENTLDNKSEDNEEEIPTKKSTQSDKIGLFSNKETKLLFKTFVPNKNIKYSPLENEKVYIVSEVVPFELTSFEYFKKLFNEFDIVGFNLFDYRKNLSIKNIRRIAQIKGANVVIIKKIFNFSKDLYIYDILYLKGDLSKVFFWDRNAGEAFVIDSNATSYSATEKQGSKNSLESILKIKSLNPSSQKSNNNTNESLGVLQSLDGNINSLDLDKVPLSNEKNENPANIDTNSQSLTDMDKVRQRLNSLGGLWMDSYDKSIVEIKEIPENAIKSQNDISYVNSKDIKYYGAYIVFKNDKSELKYNSYEKINTGNMFKWSNNDLKFEFNSSGKNSVYLNYDKMPQIAIIRPFPEKGVLMVMLTSGEIRYYIPLGLEVSSKFIKKLYKSLPTHIEGKESGIGKNPTYGSGMYGWFVSTGVLLLTLGLITLF